MLAGTINALIGFFMQEANQTVTLRHALHIIHDQQVLVDSQVGGAEDGGEFVLCGCRLIMLCL